MTNPMTTPPDVTDAQLQEALDAYNYATAARTTSQCSTMGADGKTRCAYVSGHGGAHLFSTHDETDAIRARNAADQRDRLARVVELVPRLIASLRATRARVDDVHNMATTAADEMAHIDALIADRDSLRAQLAASREECERWKSCSEAQSTESMRAHVEYKQRRNEQFAAYEVLDAQFKAASATVAAECVEHVELNGHIDVAVQARDYLVAQADESGDPTGKLRDFADALRIVIDQCDRQRRRANWYEAAHKAGKQKLIESAVTKATAALTAERDKLQAEVERWKRVAQGVAVLADDRVDAVEADALQRGHERQALLCKLGVAGKCETAAERDKLREGLREACDIATRAIAPEHRDDHDRIAELRKLATKGTL